MMCPSRAGDLAKRLECVRLASACRRFRAQGKAGASSATAASIHAAGVPIELLLFCADQCLDRSFDFIASLFPFVGRDQGVTAEFPLGLEFDLAILNRAVLDLERASIGPRASDGASQRLALLLQGQFEFDAAVAIGNGPFPCPFGAD